MTVGIYAFFDIYTNKCLYVGLSSRIEVRESTHRRNLDSGTALKSFQKWYDENASDDKERLSFLVVEECETDSLNTREIYWFNKLNPMFYGMKPSEAKNWTHSEDIIRKLKVIKSKNEKFTLSKTEVEELYIEEDMSAYDIAKLWGVNVSTVFDRLKRLGIPTKHSVLRNSVRDRVYVCQVCNKEFHPKDARVKACSVECGRVNANRKNPGNKPPSRKGAVLSEASKKKMSDSHKGKTSIKREDSSKGGVVATHKRWHIDRGIMSSKCSLCEVSTI